MLSWSTWFYNGVRLIITDWCQEPETWLTVSLQYQHTAHKLVHCINETGAIEFVSSVDHVQNSNLCENPLEDLLSDVCHCVSRP